MSHLSADNRDIVPQESVQFEADITTGEGIGYTVRVVSSFNAASAYIAAVEPLWTEKGNNEARLGAWQLIESRKNGEKLTLAQISAGMVSLEGRRTRLHGMIKEFEALKESHRNAALEHLIWRDWMAFESSCTGESRNIEEEYMPKLAIKQ